MKSLTIQNLRHIIRHYRKTDDPDMRLLRLKAYTELTSRLDMMRKYKQSIK